MHNLRGHAPPTGSGARDAPHGDAPHGDAPHGALLVGLLVGGAVHD